MREKEGKRKSVDYKNSHEGGKKGEETGNNWETPLQIG